MLPSLTGIWNCNIKLNNNVFRNNLQTDGLFWGSKLSFCLYLPLACSKQCNGNCQNLDHHLSLHLHFVVLLESAEITWKSLPLRSDPSNLIVWIVQLTSIQNFWTWRCNGFMQSLEWQISHVTDNVNSCITKLSLTWGETRNAVTVLCKHKLYWDKWILVKSKYLKHYLQLYDYCLCVCVLVTHDRLHSLFYLSMGTLFNRDDFNSNCC